MSIADPTTIFGMDAPGLNQDEVAHAQGLAQQLPAKAARLRRAAQGVTDQNLAHGAGKIADFADATAAGSPPDMQTAAKATADLVQAHPELFGSSTSEIVSMAQSTVVKWQIAVALVGQATDSVSTAAAVNATADAFGQTAAMIGAVAGALGSFGLGARRRRGFRRDSRRAAARRTPPAGRNTGPVAKEAPSLVRRRPVSGQPGGSARGPASRSPRACLPVLQTVRPRRRLPRRPLRRLDFVGEVNFIGGAAGSYFRPPFPAGIPASVPPRSGLRG